MKVLLINGSPHKNGNTADALRIVENELTSAGIEAEWFQLGCSPVMGCQGCEGCRNTHRCVNSNDGCNKLIEQILDCDGVVIGSPVYFAGPNGALTALLDRAFYAAANYGQLFKGKPAAAVVSVWREGGTAAIDRLNKYFTFAQMPIVSSDYWNVYMGAGDAYGKSTLQRLGGNLADILKNC
jgi:multimeric flavodoxin WrbA